MLRHSCHSCGEMTVGLLSNRKRLNEISCFFCMRQKCNKCSLETDVTACVNGVTGIYFLCAKTLHLS